eukprot:2682380-Karenia_brevis.AAC.1
MHLLGLEGHMLNDRPDLLDTYDKVHASTLERLFPGMREESFAQAALCTSAGGLGARLAKNTALPAALASRAMARPKVAMIGQALQKAGLMPGQNLIDQFDDTTAGAVEAFRSLLDEPESQQLDGFLSKAADTAAAQWLSAVGEGPAEQLTSTPRMLWNDPLANIDEEVGGQRDEQIGGRNSNLLDGSLRQDPDADGTAIPDRFLTISHLQRELSLLVDNTQARRLIEHHRAARNHEDLRRLQEIRDTGVSHEWLWSLNPEDGTLLNSADYTLAVQNRLGAEIVGDDALCQVCGTPMNATASHAKCCAPAESTIGHYSVVRAVADGLRLADPSLATEVRGLVETSTARPADIFTKAAVPGRDAALD